MTPLKIYMCDLTHETIILVSDTIPINIGYVGSYTKKIHNDKINIKLFKYPETILKAMRDDPPDVLALSNYSWNSNLSEHMCSVAKKINPNVITVLGGTNFPHDPKLQFEFLKNKPAIDIHVELEGEVSFANLIGKILKTNKDRDLLLDEPIDGCVFVNRKTKENVIKNYDNLNITKGIKPNRILYLDDIPSPYLNGMLDHFFDGRLSPFIETNRGCPFKCSFCHTGNDYFQKIHMFSLERIKKELLYIAKKAYEQKNTILHLADVNFGMFPRDKEICQILKNTQDEFNWPTSIIATTGKNNKERVIDVTKILGNAFTVAMSVQSMNDSVLGNIKRSNIKLDHYAEINKHLKKSGRSTTAELIIGLPGESKKTFQEGVERVLDSGVSRLTTYTLMMLYGTEFKDPGYRKKFKMVGKYRIVPLNLGDYAGKKIFDYEEVCVQTKDMSFEDYLEIRIFAIIIETVLNNSPFESFFKYASAYDVSSTEVIVSIFKNYKKAPKKILEIFNNFVKETKDELWDTEEEMINFYSKDENYEKVVNGEIGGNLIYKYKSINLVEAIQEWSQFISILIKEKILENKNVTISQEQINNEINTISEFHKNKTWEFFNLNDSKSNQQSITMKADFDLLAWEKSQSPELLSKYKLKNPIDYFFGYSEEQLRERYDVFRRYGTSITALSKIVVRIKPENWLRTVATNSNFNSKLDQTRSRTRYAISN